MKIVCIIPARFKSSRFPGKPLALIKGFPMIYWVWKNAIDSEVFSDVIIATDDKRIYSKVSSFGAKVVMTSADCFSCTDRLQEVSEHIKADLYINLQGDEPLLQPATLREFIIKCGEDVKFDAYNAMMTCSDDDINNPNAVKIVVKKDKLIYCSRHPIPYIKGKPYVYKKEIGLFAFTKYGLDAYSHLKRGPLELAEEIDILRYIENDIPVRMIDLNIDYQSHGVDILSDIQLVESIMEKMDGSK